MKKITVLLLAASLVGIMALGFTGAAQAEEITPLYPGNGGGNGNSGGSGSGNGRQGGNGTGVPLDMNVNLDGVLDDMMAAYIADGLGISVEDLKAREAAGETLVEIGLSLGFDAETVLKLHEDARIAALNQAVVDGTITQEQADWMISRLDNGQYGVYAGTCTEDCTQDGTLSSQKHMRSNNRWNTAE
jgi:hypothetical protein